MMNNTNIDDLLKKLPSVKASGDFTADVMNRIAALPAKAHRQLNTWHIIGIVAGGCLLLSIAVWLTFFVFGIELPLSSLHITYDIKSFFTSLSAVKIPMNLLSGFIAGVFLLLLDAWLRNRQRKHHTQEL